MDDEKLHAVLREWEAPEPNPAMDARVDAQVRAAWRGLHPAAVHQPIWRRIWMARVSIPVPILAALLLLGAAWLSVKFSVVHPTEVAPWGIAAGFQPVPNGEARVITVKEAQ